MGRNPMDAHGTSSAQGLPRRYVAAVAAVFLCLTAFICLEYWKSNRRDVADEQVYAWTQQLEIRRTEDGKWIRWSEGTLPENDPWENPLRIRYEDTQFSESMTVSSDGPDGKQWTRDDITWSVTNMEWMKFALDSAGKVEEVTSSLTRSATRGAVSGVIEGVTDSLPEPLKKQLGIEEDAQPEQPRQP